MIAPCLITIYTIESLHTTTSPSPRPRSSMHHCPTKLPFACQEQHEPRLQEPLPLQQHPLATLCHSNLDLHHTHPPSAAPNGEPNTTMNAPLHLKTTMKTPHVHLHLPLILTASPWQQPWKGFAPAMFLLHPLCTFNLSPHNSNHTSVIATLHQDRRDTYQATMRLHHASMTAFSTSFHSLQTTIALFNTRWFRIAPPRTPKPCHRATNSTIAPSNAINPYQAHVDHHASATLPISHLPRTSMAPCNKETLPPRSTMNLQCPSQRIKPAPPSSSFCLHQVPLPCSLRQPKKNFLRCHANLAMQPP